MQELRAEQPEVQGTIVIRLIQIDLHVLMELILHQDHDSEHHVLLELMVIHFIQHELNEVQDTILRLDQLHAHHALQAILVQQDRHLELNDLLEHIVIVYFKIV